MSLRPGRFEHKRLAWALVISLAFHLLCFGGYEFGRTVLPGWMSRIKFLAALAEQLKKKPAPPPAPQPTQVPLVFVDVDPATATPEPPKDAKFYSSQNSKAANREEADTDTPKIDGHQEVVLKAEDIQRSHVPLKPNVPPETAQKGKEEPQQPEKAKPKPVVGDLAMAKPAAKLQPDPGTAEQTRPRTILEAKMREAQRNQVAGQKMKQDGGVRHHLDISAFDARATPYGAYDAALIDAIDQRWNDLLDSRQFALDRTGKVVVEFTLNYDGRVTNVEIVETTVGDTLAYVCRLAITDPAPFPKWSMDMRRQFGDTRPIRFTFNYFY
jgi:outer membrane biosynthesis protein TonB